jgi:hypothetical protein
LTGTRKKVGVLILDVLSPADMLKDMSLGDSAQDELEWALINLKTSQQNPFIGF